MDNLWNEYKELDPSYYGIQIKGSECINERLSKESCLEFIKKHFTEGNKKEALNFPFQEEFKNNGKHQHTVALYFLGLHLKNLFNEKLKHRLGELMPSERFEDWYCLKYTWFLTCLYHDTASSIEDCHKNLFWQKTKNSFDYFKKEFNIRYTPFSHKPLREGVSLVRFSESLVKKYFYYRIDQNRLDHGIFGGYYLFDRLYKNFCEKTKNVDWKKKDCEWIEGLSYRLVHLDHFAYIADAIICHNLWCAYDSKSIKKYREYGLDPLIIEEDFEANNTNFVQNKNKNKKLNIDDHPLQFMLCLLDTIEPVKRFSNSKNNMRIEAYDVLQKISIEQEGDDGIKIKWCPYLKELNSSGFESWMKDIKELDKWMAVTLLQEGENSVTIIFNSR